ncbi:response regulator [Sabulicella rubraurantiaca]|uniref:response regulator n=1 Tax=Sabulicella rubraurantiaca TaxID=2811429 RepID=UPI001A9629B2|nr:response regulator [Sabulicella rubraurantiaca]
MASVEAFQGPRVLVVEDEYVIAWDLARSLEGLGAKVVGPVGTLDAALDLLARDGDIAGAVLDVELRGEVVFPVAAILQEKGLPFVFLSAKKRASAPAAFRDVQWFEKPAQMSKVASHILGQIKAPAAVATVAPL